jgi:hypothetical protein
MPSAIRPPEIEIRKVNRLVRQLRLEATDPDKARSFEAGRRQIETIEEFAERFAIPYDRARRIIVGPPGSFRPEYGAIGRAGRIPTFGWVPIERSSAYGAPAVHLAIAWVIRDPRQGRFGAACGRDLTGDFTVDRQSARCSQCIGSEEWAFRNLATRLWEGRDSELD